MNHFVIVDINTPLFGGIQLRYTVKNIFLVAKLLYYYKCPSICPYVNISNTFRGKCFFSASKQDKGLIFSVLIPLIYEHIFYKEICPSFYGSGYKRQKCKNIFIGGYLR